MTDNAFNIGDIAPTFSLPATDGQTYDLAEQLAQHRATIVVFSCNHCPYVRAWEGRMIALQKKYASAGVVMLAINANDATRYPDDDFPQMVQRAQEMGFNFPYLRDESQEVAHAYGATHTPHIFLLDSTGTLRYRGAIDDNYDNPDMVERSYLRDALDAVLAGDKPVIDTTDAVGCTIKWKQS